MLPLTKLPPRFPRGELLYRDDDGDVYSFSPMEVLAWLAANGLVTVVATVAE